MAVVRIFECRVCARKMNVSAAEWRENPFCRRCLPQRLKAESPGKPIAFRRVNGYLEAVMPPAPEKHSR